MSKRTFAFFMLVAFVWVVLAYGNMMSELKLKHAPCVKHGMQPHKKVVVDPGRNQVIYICGEER